MHTPKISIVVPVYKVEKYIRQCIESVLSQTYVNLELLLVDDGSPDSSGTICDEYALLDKRIRVYHKENGGVSSARNVGLKNMTGEWVCFLDSDDWWEPTFLQNFLQLIKDGICDIALQGYVEENEIKNTCNMISLPEYTFNTASELIVFLEKTRNIHNGYLWHRIFKARIFKEHNIEFPLGISFAEDGEVFFKYMKHAQISKITSKCGYHYRKIAGSLTSRGKKLPLETLCHLIETYTSSLNDIVLKDKPTADIVKGVKEYMWRLLQAWHIERSIADYQTYRQRLGYIQGIITKCQMNDTKGMPIEIRALSVICLKNATRINMQLIKAIIKYKNLKKRIKSRI